MTLHFTVSPFYITFWLKVSATRPQFSKCPLLTPMSSVSVVHPAKITFPLSCKVTKLVGSKTSLFVHAYTKQNFIVKTKRKYYKKTSKNTKSNKELHRSNRIP